jgi:hypothetical protein
MGWNQKSDKMGSRVGPVREFQSTPPSKPALVSCSSRKASYLLLLPFQNLFDRPSQRSFRQYIVTRTLGTGTFGKVKLGTHQDSGEECTSNIQVRSKLLEGDRRVLYRN